MCAPELTLPRICGDAFESRETTCSSRIVDFPTTAPPPPSGLKAASPPHAYASTSISPLCLPSADSPCTPSTLRNISRLPLSTFPVSSCDCCSGANCSTSTFDCVTATPVSSDPSAFCGRYSSSKFWKLSVYSSTSCPPGVDFTWYELTTAPSSSIVKNCC